MKVAIVSLGRSHLINLARLLERREDVEVTFYTMMPKSRCRKFGYNGKVVSLLFPIGMGQMIVDRLPKVNPTKRVPFVSACAKPLINSWQCVCVNATY